MFASVTAEQNNLLLWKSFTPFAVGDVLVNFFSWKFKLSNKTFVLQKKI